MNLGIAAALAGLVFGAVALVAAQLTEGTRAMYGITGVAIGASYVLRALGDVGNGALSWASPIGWGQAMHAFSGERWWPALISVTAVVILVAVRAEAVPAARYRLRHPGHAAGAVAGRARAPELARPCLAAATSQRRRLGDSPVPHRDRLRRHRRRRQGPAR